MYTRGPEAAPVVLQQLVRWRIPKQARYIRFHGMRHPNTIGAAEIEMFLTDLAVNGHVAASTQNQAFCALLFLYQEVLGIELPRLDALRAQRPVRLPTVLSPEEVRQVLDAASAICTIRGPPLARSRKQFPDRKFARATIAAGHPRVSGAQVKTYRCAAPDLSRAHLVIVTRCAPAELLHQHMTELAAPANLSVAPLASLRIGQQQRHHFALIGIGARQAVGAVGCNGLCSQNRHSTRKDAAPDAM